MTSLITQSLSQYTRKERAIIDAVKVKFGLILLVFYICWLPNLVNSVLLWTEWTDLPTEIVSYLLYAMVRKKLGSFLKLPLPQSHEEELLCLRTPSRQMYAILYSIYIPELVVKKVKCSIISFVCQFYWK